jgi:thiol-disulfide isomerase/thioredoxin
MRGRAIWTLLLGSTALASASCASAPAARPESVPAPAFEASDLEGAPVRFDPSRLNRPVLLIFWASWCEPCKTEVPALLRLHDQHRGRLDLIGINVDKELEQARSFVEESRIPYPNLSDRELQISDRFGVHNMPFFVLVDRGAIRWTGTQFDQELLGAVEGVLRP